MAKFWTPERDVKLKEWRGKRTYAEIAPGHRRITFNVHPSHDGQKHRVQPGGTSSLEGL